MRARRLEIKLFQAVLSHEDIVDCAVVGVPDKLKGHTPLAIFIKKNDCTKGSESRRSLIL